MIKPAFFTTKDERIALARLIDKCGRVTVIEHDLLSTIRRAAGKGDYGTEFEPSGTLNDEAQLLSRLSAPIVPALLALAIEALEHTGEPIPMRLTCPACGDLHIDDGEFATKPHHTHACQECGCVWRPAIVATVGVRFLPGFKNQ